MGESFFTDVDEPTEEEKEHLIEDLQNSRNFANFPKDVVRQLIMYSDVIEYPKDAEILTQGQVSNTALFLMSGTVQILQDDQEILKLRRTGDLLDEISFINHQPCPITVKVWTEPAKIISVANKYLQSIGPVFDEIIRQMLIGKLHLTIQKAKRLVVLTEHLSQRQSHLRLFQTTADQSLDRIMFLDPYGKVLYANRAFLQMTEYTEKDVIGKHYMKLRQADYPDELYENIHAIIVEGNQFRGVSEYQSPTMGNIYETLTVTPIMEGDTINHYVAIAQNITAKEEKRKKEAEDLKYGIEFQRRMFGDIPKVSYLSCSELQLPHSGVSGDIRHASINEKDIFYFFYGDATGHGVKAALITAIVCNALNGITQENTSDQILLDLNEILADSLPEDNFTTGFFLKIKPNGELEYANAGHSVIFLIRTDQSSFELIGKEPAVPLGLFPSDFIKSYPLGKTTLYPGDRLFFYTDGVTEAQNRNQEMFGEERLELFLQNNRNYDGNNILSNLEKELYEYRNGADQIDDISACIIQYGES